MELNEGTWKAFRKREKEPFAGSALSADKPAEDNKAGVYLAAPGGTEHYANFIDAIRSGNNDDLHADILEGHLSSSLPILANISYRLGRELKFMGEYEKFANDPEADLMLTRNYRKPYVIGNEI